MGRTITPKYRIEYRDNLLATGKSIGDAAVDINGRRLRVYQQCWKGRVSNDKLEAWRKAMNASFAPNGCNEHISREFGMVPHISYARIVEQKTERIVAEVEMPAFEIA